MRLTFSTIPQLAVLAKILCLLMVVMCGAVPAMVRSVSLYATCSSGNITVIGRGVKAMVQDERNAPFQALSTQSEDFSRKLYIYAEKSQRYICFNKHWKLVALPKKQRSSMCQFREEYHNSYLRYRSVVNETKFIGFNKHGKPVKGPRPKQLCYNFIKYNPNFSISAHNEVMAGEHHVTREDSKKLQVQQSYHSRLRPRSQQRAKKNSIQPDDMMRDTPIHRHRHRLNRFKRNLNFPWSFFVPRKRLHSNPPLEANLS